MILSDAIRLFTTTLAKDFDTGFKLLLGYNCNTLVKPIEMV